MYTTSKSADKNVEEDMKIIKEIIIREFNKFHIKALVLFGGFGHGEGSFKKIRGKIFSLNDYDLYIITDKQITKSELERVGKECSKAIGRGGLEFVEDFKERYDENLFFHVDLHCLNYNKLNRLYPTQRSFDLKTSLVIYGDENILRKIPKIKISESDALRLLFNKLNHFAIAENNEKIIKKIYAVKGFTDLCSAILISYSKYVSSYQKRIEIFKKLPLPKKLKKLVKKATNAKLKKGYEVENTEEFFNQSRKWVEYTLKDLLKKYLKINKQEEDWKIICEEMYKKLPYIYFNDYLHNKYLFPIQYYLNIKFFLEGLRKKEFLIKSLMNWRDVGLIIAISLILYSFNEKEEAQKYLKKLTNRTKHLKERILKLYSIYYLQKLI